MEFKTPAGMSSISFPAQHSSCLSLKETSASLEHYPSPSHTRGLLMKVLHPSSQGVSSSLNLSCFSSFTSECEFWTESEKLKRTGGVSTQMQTPHWLSLPSCSSPWIFFGPYSFWDLTIGFPFWDCTALYTSYKFFFHFI